MYTALCLANIDVPKKEVTYTLAGFGAPLLKSNGKLASLDGAGHGLPLGAELGLGIQMVPLSKLIDAEFLKLCV